MLNILIKTFLPQRIIAYNSQPEKEYVQIIINIKAIITNIQYESRRIIDSELTERAIAFIRQNTKEKYPIDQTNISGGWVLPIIFEKIVDLNKTLMIEKPIEMGTPDPYNPQK